MSGARRFGDAALALLFVAALALFPPHRARLRPGWNQIATLPARLGKSLLDISAEAKGTPWLVAESIRRQTFDDAVIEISDDPRDRELASLLWMAYTLYPRVLVQPKTVRDDPGLQVDYVLITPNFPPEIPREERGEEPGMMAVSDRAKRYRSTGESR